MFCFLFEDSLFEFLEGQLAGSMRLIVVTVMHLIVVIIIITTIVIIIIIIIVIGIEGIHTFEQCGNCEL